MISPKNKLTVINVLDDVLGIGTSLRGNEQSHHCPFCHHHKKKLQINLTTQKWHCWVCNSKGRRIASLLRKLNADQSALDKIYGIYGDEGVTYEAEEEYVELKLPEEFKQLYYRPKSINPIYSQARSYISRRGISSDDLIKYNIGYCEGGLYGGRVIIPSYNADGKLNYFVARSFYDNERMKYKNPPVSRNVIMFENHINWEEPIVLVEGVFDAFSVKRNAIPILGKFIPKKLMDAIFQRGVTDLYLMLDNDAIEDSVKYANYFLRNGIKVKHIIPEETDFGDLGFHKTIPLMKHHPYSEWDTLVMDKLRLI